MADRRPTLASTDGARSSGRPAMKIETLLPLGKVDPGLRAAETPLDIAQVGADARLVEQMGYDGLVTEETKDDPYVVMALAAQATKRLKLATGVAMAFPRSPTITAISASPYARSGPRGRPARRSTSRASITTST